MSDSKSDKLEQLKLELNARLEEYKAVRAEIVSTLASAYQTNTLTITAVGVLIAGSHFILQYQRPYLFVVASFVFYALAWAQLRYLVAVYGMSNHIATKVAPKIREGLKKISPDDSLDFSDVMTWELEGRKNIHLVDKRLLPIEVARYGIPVLVAVISFVSYMLIVWQRFKEISSADWVLMLLNVALFTYTALAGIQIRANLQEREGKLSGGELDKGNVATEQLLAADRPQLTSHQRPVVSSKLPPSSAGG